MIDAANVIRAKSAEFAGVPSFGVDRPGPEDWEKTIPGVVKIIRENPVFAPLKKIVEELSHTNCMIILTKAQIKLIEHEFDISAPGSQKWKAACKKLDAIDICEYKNKRIYLLEELHKQFYLTYYAICNYRVCVNGKPMKSSDDVVKIREKFENDAVMTKLARIIVNDLHLWNQQIILDDIINSGKLPREDKQFFPEE